MIDAAAPHAPGCFGVSTFKPIDWQRSIRFARLILAVVLWTVPFSDQKFLAATLSKSDNFLQRFLLLENATDPELARRARLVARFGFLGLLFGTLYALFYLYIGHMWGVGIIAGCTVAFGAIPFIMRSTHSVPIGGNLLTGIMAAGFTALCLVEGGMRGHAVAWLVTVPLCSLLLVGKKSAAIWTAISFLCASVVVALDVVGNGLPFKYAPEWHFIVSSAGYIGLIIFMFMLGMIFETGREKAFAKMQEALRRLEASNQKLVLLNNEKNEFLGIAAHDLKNPLTSIIGNAELITYSDEATKAHTLANKIVSAGIRMRDLIKNLLDANAIEEGRFTSDIQQCDLQELVRQTVEHNQTAATRKEISLKVAGPAGVYARADRAAVTQILDNLISNAVKYSPLGTLVFIAIRSKDGKVSVTVKDQGPGLSEEDQKKLFQKFTRLTARPTAGESSNGLGLSIVKRLAEAMSGTVECQSTLGKGSSFMVHLPMWEEAIAQPVASQPEGREAFARSVDR